MKSQLDALIAAAQAVGNETTLNAAKSHEEAFQFTVALIKSMDAYSRPKDVSFYTANTRIHEMIVANDAAGKKDLKANLNVMKTLTDSLQFYLWAGTNGNDEFVDYMQEIDD